MYLSREKLYLCKLKTVLISRSDLYFDKCHKIGNICIAGNKIGFHCYSKIGINVSNSIRILECVRFEGDCDALTLQDFTKTRKYYKTITIMSAKLN